MVPEQFQYEWVEVHAGHNTLMHEHQVILSSCITLWQELFPQIQYLMFSVRASFFVLQQLFSNVMAKFVIFVDGQQHRKK
jgi:hypothetical protein